MAVFVIEREPSAEHTLQVSEAGKSHHAFLPNIALSSSLFTKTSGMNVYIRSEASSWRLSLFPVGLRR